MRVIHRSAAFGLRHDVICIIQGQTMPKKDKMEIKFAFLALAFFASFMAARSLTAYFKKK